MAQGVLRVEELSTGPHFIIQIQGQRLVVDLNIPNEVLDPRDDLLADDDLGQRARQTRLQVTQIVNDVPADKNIHHQRQGRFDASLLIDAIPTGTQPADQ